MEITEVRIKLTSANNDKLRAFCSITLDNDFVIRDLKVIEGAKGPFVAMPSRKLTERCPRCGVRYVGRTWLEGFRDAAIVTIPWLLLVGVIGYSVLGVVAWLQRFAD